jgi:hypothetical protein
MMTSRPLSSRTLTARHVVSAVLGVALLGALAFGTTACEDKAIGRPCDVSSDAGAMQAVFNGQALECPTRLCVKPSRDQAVARPVDTAPYCSAECSKDSDCDGERRDKTNPRDKRCETGFVCGVAFEVGPLCCKKVCLCKDFITVPQGGLPVPASCKAGSPSTCANL